MADSSEEIFRFVTLSILQIARRLIRFVLLHLALAAVGIGAIAALCCAQSASPPRGDNQVWTDTQLAIPLNKTTDFVLIGIVRFGRNVSRPVNERIGAGISTKLGKYLTVFPFYLHIAAQPTSTNHNTEERITFEATAKFPVRKFTITDRNRIEFHFHSPPPNFTQYRNRLMISHAIRLWHTEFEGFAADEVFYDSIANAWIRNRFYLGGGKKINPHFALELYYVRQNDSHSHPGDIHALGIGLKFRL